MRIELTEADTVDASLTHWRETLIWLGVAALVSMAVAIGEVVLQRADAGGVPVDTLVLLVVFFALATAAFRYLYIPRRARAVHRRLNQRPYELSVDEQGLHWVNEKGRGGNPWDAFVKWREGKRVFLLYRSRTRFQIIPKRALGDAAAVDAFRALLRRRIQPRKAPNSGGASQDVR